MTRAFAVALLFVLAGCGSVGAALAASPPSAGKALPPAPPPPPLSDEPVVCPTDLRQCPDGRFVGRSPVSDCAFDACPGANNN